MKRTTVLGAAVFAALVLFGCTKSPVVQLAEPDIRNAHVFRPPPPFNEVKTNSQSTYILKAPYNTVLIRFETPYPTDMEVFTGPRVVGQEPKSPLERIVGESVSQKQTLQGQGKGWWEPHVKLTDKGAAWDVYIRLNRGEESNPTVVYLRNIGSRNGQRAEVGHKFWFNGPVPTPAPSDPPPAEEPPDPATKQTGTAFVGMSRGSGQSWSNYSGQSADPLAFSQKPHANITKVVNSSGYALSLAHIDRNGDQTPRIILQPNESTAVGFAGTEVEGYWSHLHSGTEATAPLTLTFQVEWISP